MSNIADFNIEEIKKNLVISNKILAHYGIVDAFGHISARHPGRRDRFLLSRRTPPALVKSDDIREFGLDGELIDDDGSSTFLERFIHSEIYAARPDVQAVVHSHSTSIIAFGLVHNRPLRAVCHTCGFLGEGTPVFEIRNVAGPATNLMIESRGLGKLLAEQLGDKSVILMRGHGSTSVGGSIAHAVYRAIYTEKNASIQASASVLGEVEYLSREESEAAEAIAPLQVERTWALWKRQFGAM